MNTREYHKSLIDEQASLAAIEAHRDWDARRKVLEEVMDAITAIEETTQGRRIVRRSAIWECLRAVSRLIGPEPTDG